MNNFRRLSILLLALAALLSACGGAQSATQTSQADVILTEGVKTMVASYFETQTALAPAATATSLPTLPPPPTLPTFPTLALTPSPTSTFAYVLPLYTPTMTVTGTPPTATVNSSGLAYGCNNLAFIKDDTIPSGTEFKPGESFTKTWRVSNTGSCDWSGFYIAQFVSGTDMSSFMNRIGKTVSVNHWYPLSILMEAPSREGTYTGYYRLTDGSGHAFGATLGVTIKVKKPAAYP